MNILQFLGKVLGVGSDWDGVLGTGINAIWSALCHRDRQADLPGPGWRRLPRGVRAAGPTPCSRCSICCPVLKQIARQLLMSRWVTYFVGNVWGVVHSPRHDASGPQTTGQHSADVRCEQ